MDIMLDIETLGVVPGNIIFEVGLAVFEPKGYGVLRSTRWPILVSSAQEAGLTIDWNTVEWWHQLQTSDTRTGLFDCEHQQRSSLRDVLTWTAKWCKGFDDIGPIEHVWAKSPQFDCVMMEDAYRRLGMQCPWTYRQPRDVRTLMDAAGLRSHDIELVTGFMEHDPEMDCRQQVAEVQEAMRRLSCA